MVFIAHSQEIDLTKMERRDDYDAFVVLHHGDSLVTFAIINVEVNSEKRFAEFVIVDLVELYKAH